ncbi:MAG: phosphatase PAP2 family protein [Spirochaetaceae bacterium]|nr:phosphatase PAP2 family protein [Spirochaetaceae bacterium]
MKKIILCVVLLLSIFSNLSADFSSLFSGEEGIFKLNPVYDGFITGGGIVLNAGTIVAEKTFDVPVFDGNKLDLSCVNPVDRWAAQPYSKELNFTGTVTEAIAMLSPAVLFLTNKTEWGVIGVMYAESFLWANGLKELTKNVVHRDRPYMYFDNPPMDKIKDGDYIRSFPSGHTTVAFNGAVFTSYVFAKYFPESKLKVPVIAGSMAFATATAVQRVLSGNHFITDVVAGAVLGSISGFIVPFLHTIPVKNEKLDMAVTPMGFVVSYKY